MAGNVCWGVEVGAGAVKAVKLERTGDTVTVVDFAIIPHKRVLSTPDIDEREAKRLAIGQLVTQHDLRKTGLALSVPGHSTFARFAKLPPVEPKKIPAIVKFEAVQQIPFPIDDVEWDYQTFASSGSPDVEVGIFAITRDKVNEKLAKWADVGLTPDCLTLSPLAAYNAMAYDMQFTEKTPGTVILDIGTTSTDLIVAEGGRLWIRTFPIGGHQFTEALVTAFNASYAKAEKLKREAESTQHTRHVLQAMRPVFGDLAQDVQRSIGYYMSTHRDAKLTRLVGLGSTFHLPGLRKFLSQQLQIEVVRLEGFQRLRVEGDRNAEFQAHAMELATAVGCGLQGLGLQTIDANLMPLAVVREAMWGGKTKWFATAAALAVAAGGASFIRPMLDKQAVAGTAKPAIIADTISRARSLKSEWTTVEGSYKVDPRAGAALSLLQHRDVYAYMLNDVGVMMKSAADQFPPDAGKDSPRLRFERFDTTYDGGGGGVGEGGAPTDPTAATAVAAGPLIHASLEIMTTKPEAEAERFVNDTFQNWLKANADRPGFPYRILLSSVKWEKRTEETEGDPTAGPDQSGGGNTGGGLGETGGGGPGFAQPGGGRRAGGGETGGGRGGGFGETGGGRRGGFGESTGSFPGSAPSGGSSTTANTDVEQIAPLPPPEPAAPPGAIKLTYQVKWSAVLRHTEPTKEGGQ